MNTITETELHCLLWGIAIGLLVATFVVMWRTIRSGAKEIDLQERARQQIARNKSLLKRMRENPPTESAGVKTEISLDRRAIVEIVDRRIEAHITGLGDRIQDATGVLPNDYGGQRIAHNA